MDGGRQPAQVLIRLLVSLVVMAPITQGVHIFCYWTVWSQGRKEDYGLKPGDIDPDLCTHLIYAFGVVGPSLTVELESDQYPHAARSIRTLNNLKNVNSNLVTLISIGGHSKGPEAFVTAARSAESRRTFAANAVKFCRDWRFDGIDIDWEFPQNGTSFTLLAQAVRKAFDEETLIGNQKRLILTAAMSVSQERIATLYDVPALNNALDYFNVMAYDFHGSWGNIAAFNSPLYSRLSNPKFSPVLSADWAVTEYIKRGASVSKVVLGLASYGRAFRLTDRTRHDVAAPIANSTIKGHVLGQLEFRMFPEVCDFINQKRARYHFDDEQKSAFVYTIDFWIGYDDPRAFQVKTEYAMRKKLAGVLIWTLDYDDVSGNHCNLGLFPLIKAVKNTIAGRTTAIPQKPLSLYTPTLNLPKPAPSAHTFKRVCYFTNWSTKRNPENGFFSIEGINPDICTHLVYSYVFVDEVGMGVLPLYDNDESISDVETGTGMYELFNRIKRYKPSIRTILSVGGETAGTRSFDIVSQGETSRRAFAENVREYLETWGFDGVEIAWIYPGYPARTINQFTFLLQTLREELDKSDANLMLFISVGSESQEIRNGYEISKVASYVDYINVRSYTYTRTDNVTYFVAPLRKSDSDPLTAKLNQEWSIDAWISGGAPAQKLMLGLTGIGRSFTLRHRNMTKPGSAILNNDVRGTILGAKGIMTHYEICDFLNRGAIEVFDPEQVAAYAYLNDIWVGYESLMSVKRKMEWLVAKGLGGFTFWTLDYDDFTGTHCSCGRSPLLTAAYRALTRQSDQCTYSTTTRTTSDMIPVPTTKPPEGVEPEDTKKTPDDTETTRSPRPQNTRAPRGDLIVIDDGSQASTLSVSHMLVIILLLLQGVVVMCYSLD